ncbi:MAG TPA: hypothetical protein VFF36_08215 [Planctomycetota bacterium]|nr:hypothetical protein [Planctomycetota bacterium]
MLGRWSVVGMLVLTAGCASHELAALQPLSAEGHTVVAAPAEEWSDVVLPTQPTSGGAGGQSEAQPADDWSHHVTIFIGRRKYSDDNLDQDYSDGSDLDMQHSGFKGLEIEGCDTSTGHGYEVGISFAYQTDDTDLTPFDYELTTEEFYGGYRYTFRTADPDNIWRPFVSLGASVIRAHIDTPTFPPFDDDASALAGYAQLGMTWDVGARLRLGLTGRTLFGTNDLDIGTPDGESSADVDYNQVAFTIGYQL